MTQVVTEWLFAGLTISTVLISMVSLHPTHPLAMAARALGYGLAFLCAVAGALAFLVRRSRARLYR
jgi:hypothetical protein